jgi:NADH-quinone oxidoreductase subunit C
MDPAPILASLQNALPGVQFDAVPSRDLHATMYAPADALHDIALVLRDRADLKFNLLAELTAVDVWPHEPRFELIYILVSLELRHRLRLKVRLSGVDPHVATVCDVWPAANWLEREVWDLFGIAFDGHPDPRRLLMPEDWEGYPLRKDYPVQIRMTPGSSEPLQMTEAEFRANVAKDRLSRG